MTSKAVQLVQLLRSSKREKRLGTVILFVTSRCNAFCQTCFYHEELNQPGDLTFAQIDKVARTMPASATVSKGVPLPKVTVRPRVSITGRRSAGTAP